MALKVDLVEAPAARVSETVVQLRGTIDERTNR